MRKFEPVPQILPRPSLLTSRDEVVTVKYLTRPTGVSDLLWPALLPSRQLEAQAWKRFAEAAGCPDALTEDDRRWLEAS